MNIRELLHDWSTHSYDKNSAAQLSVSLPLKQLAHIRALAELFPGRSTEQIITDLLEVALKELEAALPYIKGDKVIAEDEFGDPIFEDVVDTHKYIKLREKHYHRLTSSKSIQ